MPSCWRAFRGLSGGVKLKGSLALESTSMMELVGVRGGESLSRSRSDATSSIGLIGGVKAPENRPGRCPGGLDVERDVDAVPVVGSSKPKSPEEAVLLVLLLRTSISVAFVGLRAVASS